jgi:hypothetical protein
MSCIPGLLCPTPSLAIPRPRVPRIIRPLWDGLLALTAGKRPRDPATGKRYRDPIAGKRQRCCCSPCDCSHCLGGTTKKFAAVNSTGIALTCACTLVGFYGTSSSCAEGSTGGGPVYLNPTWLTDPNGLWTLANPLLTPNCCYWQLDIGAIVDGSYWIYTGSAPNPAPATSSICGGYGGTALNCSPVLTGDFFWQLAISPTSQWILRCIGAFGCNRSFADLSCLFTTSFQSNVIVFHGTLPFTDGDDCSTPLTFSNDLTACGALGGESSFYNALATGGTATVTFHS